MELEDVSQALQQRLGPHATVGLLAVLEREREEWTVDVTRQAVDQFEQRLVEETSKLRVEMAHLRSEMKAEMGSLRVELKGDMHSLETRVAEALLTMTRWTFGLWVGQVAATAAIVAGMFQIFLQ